MYFLFTIVNKSYIRPVPQRCRIASKAASPSSPWPKHAALWICGSRPAQRRIRHLEILHAKVIKYLSCAKCSEVFRLARSVRVEEGTYRKLSRTAGRLQAMRGRPVSLDETIWFLLKGPREEGRISELAGSWEMSESEAKEIERSLREGWKRWNLRQYA